MPTGGGGSMSDTLGEGEDNVWVEGTGRGGGSATVARDERDVG